MANPFEVLGVGRNATETEIKAAFKAKAKEWHPDKHPQDKDAATAKFAEISAAYDELKDGKAATWTGSGQKPFGNPHGFHDPFAGMAGFGSRGAFVDIDEMMRNYNDQVNRMRGKNPDIGLMHTMTLEEAYQGKTLKVALDLRSGHKTIDVTIPPGVDTGTRLHVPGKGQDSDPKLPPGDLFVNIQIVPHNDMLRSGPNLIVPHAIDIFKAILGGTLPVKTIDGKTIEVTIPKGVGSGAQLRVTRHGMPIQGVAGGFGDLIVSLEVKMPSKLTADQVTFIGAARDATTPDAKQLAALEILRS